MCQNWCLHIFPVQQNDHLLCMTGETIASSSIAILLLLSNLLLKYHRMYSPPMSTIINFRYDDGDEENGTHWQNIEAASGSRAIMGLCPNPAFKYKEYKIQNYFGEPKSKIPICKIFLHVVKSRCWFNAFYLGITIIRL